MPSILYLVLYMINQSTMCHFVDAASAELKILFLNFITSCSSFAFPCNCSEIQVSKKHSARFKDIAKSFFFFLLQMV